MASLTLTIALAVLYAIFMLVSAFYHQLYGMPKMENGTIDISGYSLADESMNVLLDGEWEFFYNKWIITDGYSGESDGTVKMPGRWTGMEVDGKKLPAAGFASYRITLKNSEYEHLLRAYVANSQLAFRVFMNGELNILYGQPSKQVGKDTTDGSISKSVRYKAAPGEEVVIVVEISATDYGGMLSGLWLSTQKTIAPSMNFLVNYFPYVILGIMLAFAGFSIIMNFGSGKNKQYFSAILAFATLLHFLTTKEVLPKIAKAAGLNFGLVFRIANPLTALLLIACAIVYLIAEKAIRPTKPFYIGAGTLAAAGAVSYIFLRGYTLSILSPIFFILLAVLTFVYLSVAIVEKQRFAKVNAGSFFVLISLLLMEHFDIFAHIVYGTEPIFSIGLVLYLLFICIMSFIKARINARLAMNALKYEHEISVIKTGALRAQIKPHFVFNSLAAIQAVYHKGLLDGDAAMARFSQHLRLNIDADNIDLVPFSEELENILNYFELENMRVENALTLLLDIDYMDFSVPILSLQPLIENAVRYAGTEQKEDGYIQLKTQVLGDTVHLCVIDNGRGFDVSSVRPNAAGLKNLKERFRYLLNADVTVKSRIGEGTQVTIIIPIAKTTTSEVENENSYS